MESATISIVTSLISFITCGIAALIGANVRKFILEVRQQHQALVNSQRVHIKCEIIRIYDDAKNRGYISHMELDVVTKIFEIYETLGGNSYIHTLMNRIKEMDVAGEEIPED